MAKYNLLIKPSAGKELAAIGLKKDRQRIVEIIRSLSDDPRPTGSRKLSGEEKYRVRCGDYRIVYSIEDTLIVVYVIKIGHRREVYRR